MAEGKFTGRGRVFINGVLMPGVDLKVDRSDLPMGVESSIRDTMKMVKGNIWCLFQNDALIALFNGKPEVTALKRYKQLGLNAKNYQQLLDEDRGMTQTNHGIIRLFEQPLVPNV